MTLYLLRSRLTAVASRTPRAAVNNSACMFASSIGSRQCQSPVRKAPASRFFHPMADGWGSLPSGKLRKVPVEGGAPVTLCDAPRGRGADWGPDNSIIFAADGNTGLSQIAAAGGVPRPITTLDAKKGELSHRAPQILPGGKTVLFTVFTGEELTPSNRALSLVTGQTRTLVEIGSWARYVPGDHLIYVSNGVAMTAPFDPKRLTVTGPPTPLTEDVRQSMAPRANLWQFAVSAEGSLVFIPGGRANQRSLAWVDRHGVGTPLGTAVRGHQQVRLSPDGQRLALTIRESAGPDIWIYELTHDRLTRLTSDGNNMFPVWSPDNTHIAFASGRFGPHNMFVKAADGSGPTERLLTSDKAQRPRSWSPDGRMLNFSQDDPMPDIWTLALRAAADAAPTRPAAGLPDQLPNLAGWSMAWVHVGGIGPVRDRT